MKRPVCANCFFRDKAWDCRHLNVTNYPRNCTPTDTECAAKLTTEQATAKGYTIQNKFNQRPILTGEELDRYKKELKAIQKAEYDISYALKLERRRI